MMTTTITPYGPRTTPRIAQPPRNTRAGDSERERTAGRLGLALTHGYLEMGDYERRLESAFAACTTGELRDLVADLPVAELDRRDPRRREAQRRAARLSVRLHLAAYLLMVVIVLTVWTAVALSGGPTYFWPVWPILGAGIGLLGHAIPIRIATARS